MHWIEALSYLLNFSHNLVLFVAPPAWGKTFMLKKLIFKKKNLVVFVSPLKALALEQYFSLKTEYNNVYHISENKNGIFNISKFCEQSDGVLIITPELLSDNFLNYIKVYSKKRVIFVFDEFHLFYSWGESFRPIMNEVLLGVAIRGFSVLGLSATINNKLIETIKVEYSNTFHSQYYINIGNMKLLNRPNFELGHKGLFKESFKRRFLYELKKTKRSKTILYFCNYRNEVDEWLEFCKTKNISALGCKGGEVDQFIDKLDIHNPPQCLFATSCLSHGVNLPKISKVFINHRVEKEFLIQMLGRGGRRGETFDAFHCNYSLSLKDLFYELFLIMYFILKI